MTTTNSTTEAGSAYLTSLQKQTSKTDSSTGSAGSALGKDAFLQLLVTQMKNQNPLDPQENGEFVAQLAQFSSLESMQSLNDSVTSIAAGLQSSQALQASSLVGRNVIVETSKALVDTSKEMKGTVNLTSSSTATSVGIYDKDDKLVRTIDLGTQKAGKIDFTWNGLNDDGEAVAAGAYTFKATASIDGKATTMTTNLPASVTSVTMGTNGSEMTLNLAGLGSVALSKIQSIGI
ncbi:flagellar hook assembly protein FlgD [Pseudomonas shirazica]|jgi:flagellar basal-body rod modification protein FlgD|uniref:Basal-body rod modification protein FlgD n=1 Tax=Pseudomonas taiwanensis SJ9 TaxID=1388762 RepID=V7DD84_9PSED|nr:MULTISPECIES: flagellar hook assembly protein FlgD [Pseudomonas]AEJ14333.1 flagellar basal body rod modification protein [Pseudomonas putida S16]ESW39668.1 flagellar basal body rod modification protein FlgD [Pseudomonas taiwanensis SJ9]KAF4560135.1 flagellar hook assembly protein FlgD [Pseudomonas sp. CES]MBF8788851.1 flagellar hook assembly protein FlgD [Pseudomonas asiatica]MBO2893494.1 flagellar hook assembly protein FlgD [Pseudomonas asiatica]